MKKTFKFFGLTFLIILSIVGISAIVNKVMESPEPIKYPVEFKVYAPQARSVFVTGSFNEWHSVEYRLEKKNSGDWETTILIPRGRYEYKFIVDSTWTHDVRNPIKVPVMQPYSGYNSVLEVPGDQISKY